MSDNQEEYNYQGSYVLERIKITNNGGDSVDLRNLMGELNVYEDLFQFMTGAVFVIDGIDLINKMKIVGGEKISIAWNTNGKESIEIEGRITAITDRTKTENHLQGYWLRFCSEEYYKAISNTLSRSYEGTYHEIVSKLYNEYIKVNKDLTTDNSAGLASIIIPNWRLDQCLVKLARKARDNDLGPFIIYETVDSFEYKSLNELMKQPEYTNYFYEPSNISNLSPTDRFVSFSDYDHNECFNKLQKCLNGIYARQHRILDLDTKDIQTFDFEFNDKLSKMSLLGSELIEDDDIDKKVLTFDFGKYDDDGIAAQFVRDGVLTELTSLSLNAVVAGDSELRCGYVIKFDIPIIHQDDASLKTEEFASGKRLITALKHTITKESYTCTLQAMKNSLG